MLYEPCILSSYSFESSSDPKPVLKSQKLPALSNTGTPHAFGAIKSASFVNIGQNKQARFFIADLELTP